VIGVVAERFAELADCGVESSLEVHERVRAPEALAELGAGDELARTLEQGDEQSKRQILDADRAALLPELTGGRVGLEVAEAVALAGRHSVSACHHGGSPGNERRLNSG